MNEVDESDNESDSNSNSLDIYKYRKRKDRNELFKEPDGDTYNVQNETIEDDMAEKPKIYAILQENRTEFTNCNLRYFMLIYTNNMWNFVILSVVITAYILESWLYTFCLSKDRTTGIITLIICLNLIFTFDVVIIFCLKFIKRWRRTLNLVEPETCLVILDVMLAMPYGILYFFDLRLYKFDLCFFAPLVAGVRVYRVIMYFYNKSSQAGRNQWTTFLFQYLILFLLGVHTLTCIWFQFAYRGFELKNLRSSWSAGAIHLPTASVTDWYCVCAYWSIMMLTTNSFGDLYPITTAERIIAIVAVVIGFLLTTIVFVGSLTSQFLTITTRRSKYVRQLKKIQNHLKLIRMNDDTTRRIIRYYEDLWNQKSGVFKPKLMNLLPYPLRMEICYDLNAVPLYSSLIFRRLPEPFLRRLSLAMSHQFYLPGDIVYNQNQTKTLMICITNGVLELLSDEDDESPMISFTKGTCLGEVSLVYNIPAKCTVKAATYVECQVLHKKDFIKLMITYPDLEHKIRLQIEERIKRCQRRKQTRNNKKQLSLNIYISKNIKKSSIKCLKDKLRSIQGKMAKPDNVDDNLDLNCLDLYILSEHVKKKTTMFTCMSGKFPWILEADCHLVRFWELYILSLVSYICIVYPYYIGFMRTFPGGILYYFEIVISISLLFNIVITCATAVKTKKKYIRKIRGIVSYRLNTLGFYLDLLANIPLEYILWIHTYTMHRSDHRNHLYYMIKGIKLCLVWRISSFFENLEKKLLLNTIVVKVVKYCVYICLLCYWCGVILFMESCFVPRCSEGSWYSTVLNWEDLVPEVTISRKEFPLVTSIYFATTMILAVGYGDLAPGDMYDMSFVAFFSLYGVLLIGYCVAEFSAVVTHSSRTKTAFLEVILTIDKFMEENKMHRSIKERIMAFYELQWHYNLGVELTSDNWLEKTVVPAELRKKVLHQARFKTLTSIKFFQVKNKEFIHTLTESARDIILPPGEIVYYGGTVSRELYVIESGYCLLTSKELRETKKERVIGPGNHLGLLVLLYGVPAVSSVVTLTHCKLISIGHSAYTSALSLFPAMREHDELLTPNELQYIEELAASQSTDDYLKHHIHNTDKKIKITSMFQKFFDDSFINVYNYYTNQKQSYLKSYKQFSTLEYVAPYLLIPIVIKPDGICLKTWALLRVAAAFLLCLMIPITVSMAPMFRMFNIPILVLEVFCYIDLYLMFHVAYYGSKNQLIIHPYLTAQNYLKRAFIIDFLTCWPWYAIWEGFMPKHNEGHTDDEHYRSPHMYHCLLRMVNVLQIYKLYAVFWTESIGALKRAYVMSVVQFIILMLFFLNFYTSLIIMMSCRFVIASNAHDFTVLLKNLTLPGPLLDTVFYPGGNMICKKGSWIDNARDIVISDHISPKAAILLGYYWTASTFSGAGFGDITPQDTTNMIMSICISIHGVLFFGYVYARIASLKAMADQMVTKFQENLKQLEFFLTREKVPTVLKQNVMEHWKHQWKRTGGWSHQTILGKLHANLNEDAVLYMYEKTLQEIPLFEGVEYSFFRAFAKKLSELYFQKRYMVIRANEVISHMYIIYRGKVDIISEYNEVEACMGPGGIFGNIRGASMYLTMSNVVASRNIDLLRIDGVEFYALLKSYPSVLQKVKNSVDNAPKDYVLPSMVTVKSSLHIHRPSTMPDSSDEEDNDDLDVYMESPQRSIAESHGSRSITSAGNVEYVSAIFLLFKPHRWLRSSVIPDCKWIQFMEYFISVLSYIDFMTLVYQLAFQSVPYFYHICIITDIIFLYKLFLDIHTGYMNRYGEYVLNPKRVRQLFFSRRFQRRRDFLANLPISYIVFAINYLNCGIKMIFFSYLRTPQLSRISYLFTNRTHRKVNIGSANLFIKLAAIGIWASILSHINACLFFKLSCLTPLQCTSSNWMAKPELNLRPKYYQKDYFSLYIASLWYMINLLTIAGTGDVSSRNAFEMVETIVIIVIIKFCTGLLISEMSAMISAHSSSRIDYDYGINELRDGLRDMDLSEHQMNKMWDYVRELWNRQQGRQMPELVYELPFRLRCQVMQAVYGSHIRESVIFSRTDADFRRMLAMWINHCVFFPGNYIVQCGDADQCIYFIHRGEVEVLTVHPNLTESIYDILGPEDCFGLAQGLFVGVSHHFSFRARTVVDIVYLKLEQWKYLLDFYPKSAKMVQKKVQNVYLAI
ncbi:uncharacterized protein LOC134751681 [Cydia strobilella]|uniref:uncharacterized protein LOC134751681 n=1 Tax=Cydia strobilella TaxID=1100964 RepID=UPI003005E0F0